MSSVYSPYLNFITPLEGPRLAKWLPDSQTSIQMMAATCKSLTVYQPFQCCIYISVLYADMEVIFKKIFVPAFVFWK